MSVELSRAKDDASKAKPTSTTQQAADDVVEKLSKHPVTDSSQGGLKPMDPIVLDDSGSEASHSMTSEETAGAVDIPTASHKPNFHVDGPKRKFERLSEGKLGRKPKERSPTEAEPKIKRTRIRQPPPGRTDGPAVKYSKECSRLTGSPSKGRNLPRLIDMTAFPDNVNLETAAMADFVATILFNHNPDTLNQFLDNAATGNFEFVIQDRKGEVRPFAITAEMVDGVTEVHIGYYNLPGNTHFRNYGVKWSLRYVYKIDERGKWRTVRLEEQEETTSQQKSMVESKAADLGRHCLLTQIWDSCEDRYAFRITIA